QLEQSLLRPDRRGRAPPRSADGAQQDGVGAAAESGGLVRQRYTRSLDGDSPDGCLAKIECVPVQLAHRGEDAYRFRGHFRTDAVARQDRDQRPHPCSFSYAAIASSCSSRYPSSSTPWSRQRREKGSMAKLTRASPNASVHDSRSMLTRTPGDASRIPCVAGSTITGRSPLLSASPRKMAAMDELTPARKPESNHAQGRWPRDDPQPKFAPPTSTCAPRPPA